MRSRWVLALLATIGLIVLIAGLAPRAQRSADRTRRPSTTGREADRPGEAPGAEDETAPEDWFITQRAMPNGISAGALQRARSQAAVIGRATAATGSPLARAR